MAISTLVGETGGSKRGNPKEIGSNSRRVYQDEKLIHGPLSHR
jgi:hypothetical protein